MECPDEIQSSLLEILRIGLLRIRSGAGSSDLVFAEADHLHNVPDLLNHFDLAKLRYYWEVERLAYIRASGVERAGSFRDCWLILEDYLARAQRSSSSVAMSVALLNPVGSLPPGHETKGGQANGQ